MHLPNNLEAIKTMYLLPTYVKVKLRDNLKAIETITAYL